MSPDGRLKAYYKDGNVWISGADEHDARAITTDGSVSGRIKYGSASWVYGEELSQRTAMWWSPDSGKVAYYRFDERSVRDYFVVLNQTQIRPTLDTEAFPQAEHRPVDLFIMTALGRSASTSTTASRSTTTRHHVYRVGRPAARIRAPTAGSGDGGDSSGPTGACRWSC